MKAEEITTAEVAATATTRRRASAETVNNSTHSGIPEFSPEHLPTKFLMYPKGASITYRPYTFGELLKLNQSNIQRADRLEFILEGITTTFDRRALALFDFIYISTLRKLATLKAPKFITRFTCRNCGEANRQEFKVGDIELSDLTVDALPLSFDLECGREVSFIPLTIGKYIELLRSGDNEDPAKTLAASVCNMPIEEAEKLISEATGEDLELLKEVDEMLFLGINPFEAPCSKCGTIEEIQISNDDILIEPFREGNISPRDKIRSGVSPRR